MWQSSEAAGARMSVHRDAQPVARSSRPLSACSTCSSTAADGGEEDPRRSDTRTSSRTASLGS